MSAPSLDNPIPLTRAVLACSALTSAIFHLAPDRSFAALTVPIVWIWTWLSIEGSRQNLSIRQVLTIALATRLLQVGTPPLLSDDLYRYAWEGLALRHGVDVFSAPPSSVAGLDDALRDHVNHPSYTSIYPPLALLWFQLVASLSASATAFQAATAAVDLLTVATLYRWGRQRALALNPGVLWASHPLAALESAHGAHIDVVAVCAGVIAVYAAARRHLAWSAFATWTGVGLKLFPLVWAPVHLRTTRWQTLLGATVIVGGVALLGSLPVLGAGSATLHSLDIYARTWSFNGALYPLLRPLCGEYTRSVLVLCCAFVVLLTLVRTRDLSRIWFTAGVAFVLAAPTMHPWYGLWLLAPAALRGRRWAVWLASTLPTSYLVLSQLDPATGAWHEPWWLWYITWSPALIAAIVSWEPEPLQGCRER